METIPSELNPNHKNDSPLIIDFREMIDGNFTLVLDGEKLMEQADAGITSIDLNGLIRRTGITPLAYLTLHKIKTSMRGDLPQIIKEEISELINETQYKLFLKKYGFGALEVPVVRDYIKNLICIIRDKTSPKDKVREIKNKLNSFVTSVCFTERKRRILKNFRIPDFLTFYEKHARMADQFYEPVTEDCKYCLQKQKSYKQCPVVKRKICSELRKYLPDYFSEEEIIELVRFDNKSDYLDYKIKHEFHVDSEMCAALKQYGQSVEK